MSELPPHGAGGMRLFVAVWPPPEVVAALAALPRPEIPGLRWTSPAQWHVTLRFLGWVPDPSSARTAFGAVDLAGLGPVIASAGPRLGRFGHRVLHLPVAGLETVAARVVVATGGIGRAPEDRLFSGHLTLARAGGRRRPTVDLSPFTGVELAATWPVRELTLVHSAPAGGGVRYDVVDRLALPTPEGA